jgi:hypothetical protein
VKSDINFGRFLIAAGYKVRSAVREARAANGVRFLYQNYKNMKGNKKNAKIQQT